MSEDSNENPVRDCRFAWSPSCLGEREQSVIGEGEQCSRLDSLRNDLIERNFSSFLKPFPPVILIDRDHPCADRNNPDEGGVSFLLNEIKKEGEDKYQKKYIHDVNDPVEGWRSFAFVALYDDLKAAHSVGILLHELTHVRVQQLLGESRTIRRENHGTLFRKLAEQSRIPLDRCQATSTPTWPHRSPHLGKTHKGRLGEAAREWSRAVLKRHNVPFEETLGSVLRKQPEKEKNQSLAD